MRRSEGYDKKVEEPSTQRPQYEMPFEKKSVFEVHKKETLGENEFMRVEENEEEMELNSFRMSNKSRQEAFEGHENEE